MSALEFVVAHPVVSVRPDRLDVLAQLIDRDQLAIFAGEQDQLVEADEILVRLGAG
jgi:hypothetical protein